MSQPDFIPPPDEAQEDEALRKLIPFFRNWRSFYLFVLGELLLLIVLFYLFSLPYR
jgi:ATP/ADP translocase